MTTHILVCVCLVVQYWCYLQYLTWERRLQMLHNVAAGMSYLHGRNVAHGDLRSPNLFVGADGTVSCIQDNRHLSQDCDSFRQQYCTSMVLSTA